MIDREGSSKEKEKERERKKETDFSPPAASATCGTCRSIRKLCFTYEYNYETNTNTIIFSFFLSNATPAATNTIKGMATNTVITYDPFPVLSSSFPVTDGK